jgi:hypothetical protein
MAAAGVGNYALFGGGYDGGYLASSAIGGDKTVDAYNAALTRVSAISLSEGRRNLAAASSANYALFGGGESGVGVKYVYHTTVDKYDSSLTRSTPAGLGQGRVGLAATSVGNYALFGGGVAASGRSDKVNVYLV